MLKEAFAAMAHPGFSNYLGIRCKLRALVCVVNPEKRARPPPPASTALIATRARSLLQDG